MGDVNGKSTEATDLGDDTRCDRCGQSPDAGDTLTATGICMECVRVAQLANARGMKDEKSPEYRRWQVAYNVAKGGRGAFITPPREWRFRERRKPYRVTVWQLNSDPLA